MNMDDLAIHLLPESVKRNILGRLNGAPAPAPVLHVAGSGLAQPEQQTHPELAQQLATRRVLLPSMSAGAAVVDNVLSPTDAQAVAAAAEAWLSQHARRPGMGSSSSGGLWHDATYRGDLNCWVSASELQAAGQHLLAACLDMLASLRTQLAAQGYDVSGRCSCQLACYPGGGARYVRHTDASDSAADRSVTALLYLNTHWDPQEHGGQLALYNAAHSTQQNTPGGHLAPPGGSSSSNIVDSSNNKSSSSSAAGACQAAAEGYLAGEPALLVAPLGGRLLVFDSRLPHEVLPAHKHRYSITMWFYKGKGQAGQGHTGGCEQGTAPTPPVQAATPQPAAAATQNEANTAAAAAAAACPSEAVQHSSRLAETGQDAAAAAAATPAGIAAAASKADRLLTIFVSIAAFRDEECQWTLRDLFVKATHPQRVFVGVVWQIDPAADAGFVRMAGGSRTAQWLPQVREVRCHYSTATGPCAARSMAQQLWSGQDYVLQVDAHMRFVQGWDELCISELQAAQAAAGHPSVVLSTYPLGYDGAGAAAAVPEGAPATLLCAKEFDACGLLRVQSRCLRQRPDGTLHSFFWAAGFSFAPAAWLQQVPYCPHLPHLFFGEEQYMLLRMVTRGWQVYAPSQPLAFHQWERQARPNSYQACVKIDAAARAASQARVLQLTAPAEPQAEGEASAADHSTARPAGAATAARAAAAAPWHPMQEPQEQDWALGGIWGLGTARSWQQWAQQAGVCFHSRTLEQRALYGGLPPEVFES